MKVIIATKSRRWLHYISQRVVQEEIIMSIDRATGLKKRKRRGGELGK